uniref:Si:ch211-67f24.7 n=1 Tax=Cyprinus carpio carpio TaxID=630221 RepID=A0A9J7XBS9_CYPCA
MTLAKAGPCEEGVGPEQGLRSRCCAESPDCGPSAFTKYCANIIADTASVTAGAGIDSTVHQRKCCRVGISQTLPRPSGILRNGREHMCDLPPGGRNAEYMWNGSAGQCHTVPICVPFPRHPREAGCFLKPVPAVGVGGNLTTAAKSQRSSAGLAVRVCGSPGLNGRVYTSELYPPPHRLDDGDTDCDVADASVFDFSSVTTCSPDETLNRLRGAEACDDEDDDEEDSKVPVLLKPSYTHNASAVQPGGGLCMAWQIPRRAPIPAEVRIGGQGKTLAPKPHRIPASAFRPIWDPTYSQGDATPAKENSVSFSSTNQIINQQQETDQSRSAYRGTGVQRAEAVWHDSEDSEGPCSTV